MVLCDLAANRVGEESLYFFTITMTIVTWIGGAVSMGGIVTLLVMYWPLGPAYLATSLLGLGGLAAFIWLQITSSRVGSMIASDIVSNVVPHPSSYNALTRLRSCWKDVGLFVIDEILMVNRPLLGIQSRDRWTSAVVYSRSRWWQ